MNNAAPPAPSRPKPQPPHLCLCGLPASLEHSNIFCSSACALSDTMNTLSARKPSHYRSQSLKEDSEARKVFKNFPFLMDGFTPKTRRTHTGARVDRRSELCSDVNLTETDARTRMTQSLEADAPPAVGRDKEPSYNGRTNVRGSQVASDGILSEFMPEGNDAVLAPVEEHGTSDLKRDKSSVDEARAKLDHLRNILCPGLSIPAHPGRHLGIPSPIPETSEFSPTVSVTDNTELSAAADCLVPDRVNGSGRMPSHSIARLRIPTTSQATVNHQPSNHPRLSAGLRRSRSFAGYNTSQASRASDLTMLTPLTRARNEQEFHDTLWAYVAEIREGFKLEDMVNDKRIWGECQ